MESADFLSILKERNLLPSAHAFRAPEVSGSASDRVGPAGVHTEGTTILALRYRDGVLVAGDRRATPATSSSTIAPPRS